MIPHSWKREKLGKCVRIRSGVAPSELTLRSQGPFAYLKVEDLNGAEKYVHDSRTFTHDKHRSLVPRNTVIFPKRGGAIMSNKLRVNIADCYVDSNLMSLEPLPGLNCEFLFYVLLHAELFKIADTSSIPQINNKHIEPYEVILPPEPEQHQIAALLMCWDNAIAKTQLLIDAKYFLLCELRESLIVRRTGVSRVKLSFVTRESTARNGTRMERDAIMAVTKSEGLRPMREETISASIDRYKIVKPSSFAYNPMRINIGSIAISSFKHDVLVSPDYVVFECDPKKLIPGYLNHLRRTSLWSQYFDTAGSGGVRIRIYYADLAAFTFPLPSIAEQARVVTQLDLAALEIETLMRYVAALKSQKRGLMQKLLTGQWRVPLSLNEANEERA